MILSCAGIRNKPLPFCVNTQSLRLFYALSLALLLGLSVPLAGSADEYRLGSGYNWGALNFAGYSNLVLEVPNQGNTTWILDDLSIFISGRFNRYVNPFIEFELTDAPLFIESDGWFNAGTPRLVLERAYNDVFINPSLNFRFGKMLSPVGEWNLIHAAPLVWTTTRPLTTYYNFSEFASGVALLYTDPDGVLPDLQVYYQPADEFLREPSAIKPVHYKQSGGFSLAFNGDLQKRASLFSQYAERGDNGEAQWLIGADGGIAFGALSLETQWTNTWIVRRTASHPSYHEWGGYVQGVYGMTEHWSLVARGELFQSRDRQQHSDHLLLGVVYRPQPAVSWKMEYVETMGPQLDIARGFYASLAILF
ncbi:MAG: hypothetical protein ACU837_09560 [Gammaproteobacteria bacterium]